MTCEHIKNTIKKINHLLRELSNPNSDLYQKLEPFFKEEDVEIERTEKRGWFKSEHKEKPIFNSNKATVVNLTKVKELQAKLDEINEIVESCHCYDEIREQSKEERMIKETLTTQKNKLEEELKDLKDKNKKLQETSSNFKAENEGNKTRVKNIEENRVRIEAETKESKNKLEEELKEKKQENKATKKKLTETKGQYANFQVEAKEKTNSLRQQINELQKYKLRSQEEKLEELVLRLEVSEENEKKIEALCDVCLRKNDNEVKTAEKDLRKKLLKVGVNLGEIQRIFGMCEEVTELKEQVGQFEQQRLEAQIKVLPHHSHTPSYIG